jgi:hypothetical protein
MFGAAIAFAPVLLRTVPSYCATIMYFAQNARITLDAANGPVRGGVSVLFDMSDNMNIRK